MEDARTDDGDFSVDQQPVPDLAQMDGGFASRKLHYAVGTSVLIAGGAVLCAFYPAFIPAYGTFIAGLLSALALYTGGNVVTKHVLASKLATVVASKVAPPCPREPEEPRRD